MARARYIYKCVPAPRRVKRAKGQKTAADALAAAVEAALSEEAAQGWEYVRTDLVPMEAKSGFFGSSQEAQVGVMVFRRPAAPPAADEPPHLHPASVAAARRRTVEDDDGPLPDIPRLGAARLD